MLTPAKVSLSSRGSDISGQQAAWHLSALPNLCGSVFLAQPWCCSLPLRKARDSDLSSLVQNIPQNKPNTPVSCMGTTWGTLPADLLYQKQRGGSWKLFLWQLSVSAALLCYLQAISNLQVGRFSPCNYLLLAACCYFLVSPAEGSQRAGCAWEALHTLLESAELCGALGQHRELAPSVWTWRTVQPVWRPPCTGRGFLPGKPYYFIRPVSQLLMLRPELTMTLHFQFSFFYSFLYYFCGPDHV